MHINPIQSSLVSFKNSQPLKPVLDDVFKPLPEEDKPEVTEPSADSKGDKINYLA